MKPLLTTLLFLSFITQNTHSQVIKIKEGAYRNLVDFHKNQPFTENVKFRFTEMREGHIYKTSAIGKSFKNSRLNLKVWAIYQDSTLYLNLKRFGMGKGYAKMLILGRYSFFHGRVRKTAFQKEKVLEQYYISGLFGAIVAEHNILKNMDWNNLFVIDLQKGAPDNLNSGYIEMALSRHPDLLNAYIAESDKKAINVMLEYIHRLNSRLPIY